MTMYVLYVYMAAMLFRKRNVHILVCRARIRYYGRVLLISRVYMNIKLRLNDSKRSQVFWVMND